jgi:hypothetical protein
MGEGQDVLERVRDLQAVHVRLLQPHEREVGRRRPPPRRRARRTRPTRACRKLGQSLTVVRR